MNGPQTLSQVFDRLDKALSALDDAVDRSAEIRREYSDAEEEVQRLNAVVAAAEARLERQTDAA